MSKISVVVMEKNDVIRLGITTALKQTEAIEVVGETADSHQGLQIIPKVKPDIVIVDWSLIQRDGLGLIENLQQLSVERKPIKIIVLLGKENEESILEALDADVDSYCLKNLKLNNLLQAIKTTYNGFSWLDPAIARLLLKKFRQKVSLTLFSSDTESSSSVVANSPPKQLNKRTIKLLDQHTQELIKAHPLTQREMEVLQLLVNGCKDAKIAKSLYITVGTVKTHVRNILNKLCVHDRTQAAVFALRAGLIS